MHPRLYMHSMQYVLYNSDTAEVTFATRHASGRRYNFMLTKNQFLSLHDAITLIQRNNSYGHFPLGQKIWLHYNTWDASLYKDPTGKKRVYFTFASFDEYVTYTHRRLLSLVRLNEVVPAKSARRSRGEGRRQWQRRQREGGDDFISANNKRSLPIALRADDQSPTSKRFRGRKRKAASRSADDVVMSHDDEESAVFSEWHCSNSRRECDSISFMSYTSQDLPSPQPVQCNSPTSSDGVESQ